MGRLFDANGVAGLTDEGMLIYRNVWNYLFYIYADSREMGVPINEVTALITRVAVGLEATFIANTQAKMKENIKSQLPDNLKQTTGYTRTDATKGGEPPEGPADVIA